MSNEMSKPESRFELPIVIYEDETNNIKLDISTDGETLWLNQTQIGLLFNIDISVINKHIQNLYEEEELDKNATHAKIAQVQNEDG